MGLTEKLWIKQWGNAYAEAETTTGALYAYTSSASVEHEISMIGYTPSHHPYHFANTVHHTEFTASVHLPRAQDHPLFYVGVIRLLVLPPNDRAVYRSFAGFEITVQTVTCWSCTSDDEVACG